MNNSMKLLIFLVKTDILSDQNIFVANNRHHFAARSPRPMRLPRPDDFPPPRFPFPPPLIPWEYYRQRVPFERQPFQPWMQSQQPIRLRYPPVHMRPRIPQVRHLLLAIKKSSYRNRIYYSHRIFQQLQ